MNNENLSHSTPGEGGISSCTELKLGSSTTSSYLKPEQLGVSLKNALFTPETFPSSYSWYVMRATYNQELKARDMLEKHNIPTYVPMTVKYTEKDGQRIKQVVPLINNLIFVYTDEPTMRSFTAKSKTKNSLYYLHTYYDKTHRNDFGLNDAVSIPHDQMVNFVNLTTIDDEFVEQVSREKCRNLDLNQRVIVTDGKFAGIIGHVARYKRQSCVVIKVDNIGLFRTAYVPASFVKPIETPSVPLKGGR